MEHLRNGQGINWLEFCTIACFPCPTQTARKMAMLINRYCTDADCAELLTGLRTVAEWYKAKAEDCWYMYREAATNKAEAKSWRIKAVVYNDRYKQTIANIETIEGRTQ